MEYLVDLGGHPPYEQPPDGFHVPSGAAGAAVGSVPPAGAAAGLGPPPFNNSDSGSDADSSIVTAAAANGIDGNSNFTYEYCL